MIFSEQVDPDRLEKSSADEFFSHHERLAEERFDGFLHVPKREKADMPPPISEIRVIMDLCHSSFTPLFGHMQEDRALLKGKSAAGQLDIVSAERGDHGFFGFFIYVQEDTIVIRHHGFDLV